MRPGELTRRQVEDALKMQVDVAIPNLPKLLGNAASMGEPAALRGAFHKGILALVAQVASAVPAESSTDGDTASRKRGWRRFAPFRL